ncbi:MAG TPA: endonuclease domain-containing protein [bacterium]|nr:endonuclease domain-containing protein [bacterium]
MNNELFNHSNQKPIRAKLRNSMTKGEVVLWNKLRFNQFGYKFRRQHGIGKYIVDFYCPELKLIIEIDGGTHNYANNPDYEIERQTYLESLGFKIKRYTNELIANDLNSVLSDLYNYCQSLVKQN